MTFTTDNLPELSRNDPEANRLTLLRTLLREPEADIPEAFVLSMLCPNMDYEDWAYRNRIDTLRYIDPIIKKPYIKFIPFVELDHSL